MVNRQILEGRWNELKGKIKERWGLLTDHELSQAEGDTEQLIGIIQQKTGAARENIEDELEDILASSAAGVERATAAAREYAQRAAEAARYQYEHMAQSVREGYGQAEGVVRRHPAESVAVAFGAGLITGIVVGMLTRRS